MLLDMDIELAETADPKGKPLLERRNGGRVTTGMKVGVTGKKMLEESKL